MLDWSEVFGPGRPVVELVVRGSVMFLVLFVLLRLVGKREAGAHSLTDLLVVVLVAQAAAHGMGGEASSVLDSVILIATVLFWSIALDALAYRWPALARLIKSRRSPLIVDGTINERALRREFINREELMTELRLHGVTNVQQVARAYLEANGMVSVIKRGEGAVDEPSDPPVAG